MLFYYLSRDQREKTFVALLVRSLCAPVPLGKIGKITEMKRGFQLITVLISLILFSSSTSSHPVHPMGQWDWLLTQPISDTSVIVNYQHYLELISFQVKDKASFTA